MKKLNTFLIILLSLMFFTSIITIIWALDKGFQLRDEGLYILSARFPEDFKFNVSAIYVYTGLLFKISGYNLVTFRLVSLFLLILSALIFWIGFDNLFKLRTKSLKIEYIRVYSLLFILIGSVLYYQWFFPMTACNYMVNSFTLNIFAGVLMLGLSWVVDKPMKSNIIFFITGLSIGLALFTVFPFGVCLSLLCIVVVLLYQSISRCQKTIILSMVFGGIIAWFSVHFLFVLPLTTSWQYFKKGWQLYQLMGYHTFQQTILHSSQQLFYLIYGAIKSFLLVYLVLGGALAYAILLKRSLLIGKLFFVIVVIAGLCIPIVNFVPRVELTFRPSFAPFYLTFYLAYIFLLVFMIIYNFFISKKIINGKVNFNQISFNDKIILLLLIVLPLVACVGSTSAVFYITAWSVTPWFGVIVLLLILLVTNTNNYWLMPTCILLISAFATSQIIQGTWVTHSLGNLHLKTVPTKVGFPSTTMLFDKTTHDLIENLTSLAVNNGFQPGDNIIANYFPGMVFAMGGRTPGYNLMIFHPEVFTAEVFKLLDIARLKKSWVLVTESDLDTYSQVLLNVGINFPANYKYIGSATSYLLYKPV